MRLRPLLHSLFCIAVFLSFVRLGYGGQEPASGSGIPHLQRTGNTSQLIVDGKPFLMLAAEIHNSSSSNLEYMRPIWPRLSAIPLNTVLTPLSWELVEPTEGKFDFTLVDGLIEQARQNNLRIVFLWLASWKNGMSSYPPLWVKENTQRFPRVVERNGAPVEILSTLGEATVEADSRAFAAVMRHIRQMDGDKHTVLMMQVENEVGVLGDSRDRSPAANKAYEAPVPEQVLNYLRQHRDTLMPDFRRVWEEHGAKTSGTWEQVFGTGARTDQIFMAWNYGRFIQRVAAAGKKEYPIPMYVNTWLGGMNRLPGEFPSGGPLPEVIDMWKAAGSSIDIYSPDIYAADFEGWCNRYHQAGNPLFIPETTGGKVGQANVFYAVGHDNALGFSPFGIDSWRDADNELGKSYKVLEQLAPTILSHQGKNDMTGFVLTKENPEVFANLNGYQLDIRLDEIFGSSAQRGYGLLIATGPNEFIGAGSGFRVSVAPLTPGMPFAGIGSIEEGTFSGNEWRPGRRLNGDENDQGKYWRFSPQGTSIEQAVVYRFR
jgi:beta-galactosidase GanA